MSYSLRDILKTKLSYDSQNIKVFTTNKTLHERFTRKQRLCILTLSNGFTAPFRDNEVKERVVFENKNPGGINRRFSSYGDADKQIAVNESKYGLKEELGLLANKRRVVLLPSKLKNDLTEYSPYNMDIGTQYKTADANTPKRFKTDHVNEDDSGLKHFSPIKKVINSDLDSESKYDANKYIADDNANNYFQRNEPYSFSSYGGNSFRQSAYTWKRGPPTKKQLDDEIDTYMAEMKAKANSTTDDVNYFLQEYMTETEKSRNKDKYFGGKYFL